MSERPAPVPLVERGSFRIATAAAGALLAGAGAWILADAGIGPWARFGLGAALVLVGANAIVAAWRSKAPWIARLGPLP